LWKLLWFPWFRIMTKISNSLFSFIC
jgi:hypothetical protein